jgi:hypothetical protein
VVENDPHVKVVEHTFGPDSKSVDFSDEEIKLLYACAAQPPLCTSADPQTDADLEQARRNEARKSRNQLQDLLVRASTFNCAAHKSSIYGNAAAYTTYLDIMAAGLAGSAAIVGGLTGQALAAGAAFATAQRAIVEKNVFQMYLAPAVIAEIQSNRSTNLEKIDAKKSMSVSDYSIDQAIADVLEYNDLCSFYSGISSLVAKSGKKTVEQENSIEKQIASVSTQLQFNKERLDTLADQHSKHLITDKFFVEQQEEAQRAIASLQNRKAVLEAINAGGAKTANGT